MVEAIETKGLIRGLVLGTDRIVRCNPAARRYHMRSEHPQILADGRIYEPLDMPKPDVSGKHPSVALALSIIPGLGRSYAGQPVDGFYSFIFVAGLTAGSANNYVRGNPIRAGISGSLAVLFWVADLYGAYRTATLAVPAP